MEKFIKEIVILYFQGCRLKDAIEKVKSKISIRELENMKKSYERRRNNE